MLLDKRPRESDRHQVKYLPDGFGV
jgi:hypothetical protein